ncbi:MAG TPA: hypothetical protein VM305_02090 [Candidatus Limnocylindrales bacterium]|nr:hypothetical protein [Candidatus Limnocylindrales bacterium]
MRDLDVSRAPREHAQPPVGGRQATEVKVTAVERSDGQQRLARVAAIIAADREGQARRAA